MITPLLSRASPVRGPEDKSSDRSQIEPRRFPHLGRGATPRRTRSTGRDRGTRSLARLRTPSETFAPALAAARTGASSLRKFWRVLEGEESRLPEYAALRTLTSSHTSPESISSKGETDQRVVFLPRWTGNHRSFLRVASDSNRKCSALGIAPPGARIDREI
jgi:hypothetical protein